MKRLIAKRRLARKCIFCNSPILKGSVYYKERTVFHDDYDLIAYDTIQCCRCKYEQEEHERRYKLFQESCEHKEEFIVLQWDYIPGEAVMHPDYYQCTLCKKIIN